MATGDNVTNGNNVTNGTNAATKDPMADYQKLLEESGLDW